MILGDSIRLDGTGTTLNTAQLAAEVAVLNATIPACADGTVNYGAEEVSCDGKRRYVYVYYDGSAPAALALGAAVQIIYGVCSTGKYGPKLQTVATAAIGVSFVGVSLAYRVAGTAAGVWVQVKGDCDVALVTASDSIDAGGESLELINAGTTLIYDADTYSAKTIAIARQTALSTGGEVTARTYTKVYLVGNDISQTVTSS